MGGFPAADPNPGPIQVQATLVSTTDDDYNTTLKLANGAGDNIDATSNKKQRTEATTQKNHLMTARANLISAMCGRWGESDEVILNEDGTYTTVKVKKLFFDLNAGDCLKMIASADYGELISALTNSNGQGGKKDGSPFFQFPTEMGMPFVYVLNKLFDLCEVKLIQTTPGTFVAQVEGYDNFGGFYEKVVYPALEVIRSELQVEFPNVTFDRPHSRTEVKKCASMALVMKKGVPVEGSGAHYLITKAQWGHIIFPTIEWAKALVPIVEELDMDAPTLEKPTVVESVIDIAKHTQHALSKRKARIAGGMRKGGVKGNKGGSKAPKDPNTPKAPKPTLSDDMKKELSEKGKKRWEGFKLAAAENEELKAKVVNLEESTKALEKAYKDAQVELQEANEALETANETLEEANGTIEELKMEIANYSELGNEFQAQATKLHAVQTELEKVKRQFNALEASIDMGPKPVTEQEVARVTKVVLKLTDQANVAGEAAKEVATESRAASKAVSRAMSRQTSRQKEAPKEDPKVAATLDAVATQLGKRSREEEDAAQMPPPSRMTRSSSRQVV